MNSLARGLSILEAFDDTNPKLGITEIYQKTSLPKSTVHRLIQTLCDMGYVKHVFSENKYVLGPKVLSLGFVVLSNLELREVSRPYLRELSNLIGETLNVAVLDKWHLVYVDRIKIHQVVNIDIHIGTRLELYKTSMGRVLAAFQSDAWLSEYLKYLKTIPEAKEYWQEGGKKLKQILKDVVENDYSINNEELAKGLRSVAAPVRNREKKVECAINIAIRSSIYSLKRLKTDLVPPLQNTARAISAALGYR